MIRRAGSLLLVLLLLPSAVPAQGWVVIPPATPLDALPVLRPATGMAALVGEIRSACTRTWIEEAWVLSPADSALGRPDRRAVTDSLGRFVLDSLAPGRYRVRVVAIGYLPAYRELDLRAGQVDTLRATLAIAGPATISPPLPPRSCQQAFPVRMR